MLYPLSYEGVRRAGSPAGSAGALPTGAPTVVRPPGGRTPDHVGRCARRRRILAPPCPSEISWPRPSVAPSPPWPDADGLDLDVDPASVHLERPARREHGDWSTNVALVTAKRAGTNPRAPGRVAGGGARRRPARPRRLDRDRRARVHQLPARRRLAARRPGRAARPRARTATPGPTSGHGERVQVEFISANPTGPIHVGNGWWGSYGDALARVLARCRLPGEPRVLRQRHRRADPDARARACWPAVAASRFPRAATRASTSPSWPPPTTGPTT